MEDSIEAAERKAVLYFQIRHVTHGRSNNQDEFAISAVVVDWLPEYQGGSVAGFEGKFPLLVSLHDSVIDVAVRRVRLVTIQRVNPAKYRHTCDFIPSTFIPCVNFSEKREDIESRIALGFSAKNFGKVEFDMARVHVPVAEKYRMSDSIRATERARRRGNILFPRSWITRLICKSGWRILIMLRHIRVCGGAIYDIAAGYNISPTGVSSSTVT